MTKPNGTVDRETGHVNLNEIGIRRFFARVNKDGPIHPYNPELGKCWLWTGGTCGNGYGATGINSKMVYATKLSWIIQFGQIELGKKLCHSCDVPGCVNPFHLWIGTCQDNTDDMIKKGRKPVGEKSGGSKLAQQQVIEIRERWKAGEMQKNIALVFNVSQTLISAICRRIIWKHVA